MIGYAQSPLAWGLTRAMARVVGVNLPSAVLEGWLPRKELGQLVSRCEACNQKPDCTAWLAVARQSCALPVFCPNKAALEALILPQ